MASNYIFKVVGSIKYMPKYFTVHMEVAKSNFNDPNKTISGKY